MFNANNSLDEQYIDTPIHAETEMALTFSFRVI